MFNRTNFKTEISIISLPAAIFFNWKNFLSVKKMFDAEQMQSADPLVIFRWCGRNMIVINEWQGISEPIAKAVSDSDIY